jgi:hypothetical protein
MTTESDDTPMTGWITSALPVLGGILAVIHKWLQIKKERVEDVPPSVSPQQRLRDADRAKRAFDWELPFTYQITQELLDQLRPLDPSISASLMDDELSFVTNNVDSDTCVVFLSGLGLDYRDFIPYFRDYDQYHCIGICLYGLQPECDYSHTLSVDTHVRMLASVVNHVLSDHQFTTLVFAGFSIGGDIGFRLINSGLLNVSFDALLCLDPNLNSETRFITGKISQINVDGRTSFDVVRELGRDPSIDTLQAWLDIHTYLTTVFSKFGEDRSIVVQNLARRITELFPDESVEPFVSSYSRAAGSTPPLRIKCAFSDWEVNWQFVEDVKERLADSTPSARYQKESLKVHPGMTHFSLINNTAFLHAQIKSLAEPEDTG